MAKVELASFLRTISGRMGNIVLYSSYGREYMRVYVRPKNPDTEKQKTVRKTFGDAVRSWQNISPIEQQQYNKKARRLCMSGYNLYISLFMKENLTRNSIKTDTVPLHAAHFRHPDSIQRADISVAVPFYHDNSRHTPGIGTLYGFPSG